MPIHGERMSFELTVTLKDSERTYKHNFLIYEPVTFGTDDDSTIQNCVDEALEVFQGEPDDIVVRAMMVFK